MCGVPGGGRGTSTPPGQDPLAERSYGMALLLQVAARWGPGEGTLQSPAAQLANLINYSF